jgi:MOSC domain-containing protein YiiM
VPKVAGIYLLPVRRGDPQAVEEARAIPGRGLEGDRKRSLKRQLTVVSAEAWASAAREAGTDVDPRWRRSNVVVSGLVFTRELFGHKLRLGEAVLEILGENEPCQRMDELHLGLRAALARELRAGVYGKIGVGGMVRVGDDVQVE